MIKVVNYIFIFIFFFISPVHSNSENMIKDGDYLYQIGKFYKASKIYRKIIRENPNDKYNFLNLIDCLYQIGNFKDGDKYSELFLKTFKNSSEYYYLLGLQRSKDGELIEAIKFFEKSIKIDKNNYKSMVDMALAMIKLGRYKETLKVIEVLKKSNDNLSEIFYILALLHRYVGDYKGGDIWFQMAIITSPEDVFVTGEYYRNSLALHKKINSDFYFRMNKNFYIKTIVNTIYKSIIENKKIPKYLKKLREINRYKQATLPLEILLLIKLHREKEAEIIENSIPDEYRNINLISLASGILKFRKNKVDGTKLIYRAFIPSYYLNDPHLYLKILEKFSNRIDKLIINKMKEKIEKIKPLPKFIPSPTDFFNPDL